MSKYGVGRCSGGTKTLGQSCAYHAGEYVASACRGQPAVTGWIDQRHLTGRTDHRAGPFQNHRAVEVLRQFLGRAQAVTLQFLGADAKESCGLQGVRGDDGRETAITALPEQRPQLSISRYGIEPISIQDQGATVCEQLG